VKKPADIIYGVGDRLPFPIALLSGLQNVAVMAVFLIFPLIIAREAGASVATSTGILSMAMLVLGIGTLLQAHAKGPIGSGYLAPPTFSAIYLGPSLVAVHTGGLALVFGMTMFAGVAEAALSRMLTRLRPYFPPEIAGLVILLVGITSGALAVRYLVDAGGHSTNQNVLAVAAVTLVTMIVLNIWTRGIARMMCALIGIVVGYGLSAALGLLTTKDFEVEGHLAIFRLPSLNHIDWSFDLALVIPFLISAIAAALKGTAVISICQKINDAEWIRPDLNNIHKGVAADGLGTTVAGMLGAFGTNVSPSCVGLSVATGITSRMVAYSTAAIFALAAFLPGLSVALALMPTPVIAAALMFTSCFLLINGMQVITSRILDSRKTFVVGLTVAAGLAVEIFPHIGDSAPVLLKPIFGSSLVLGTLFAFAMNIVFRIGVRQKVALSFDATRDDMTKLDDFLDEHGAHWGARHDVIMRARFALRQLVEAAIDHCNVRGPFDIEATFDEFNLDLKISYDGELIAMPLQRPSMEELHASKDGVLRFAGFMLRQNADRVLAEHTGQKAVIRFHFDH
jgi:xanthine permease XanP